MARLTPEEVKRIDAALEAVKGRREYATKILGMDAAALCNAIRYNPALRVKWSYDQAKPVEPSLETEIDRPLPDAYRANKIVEALGNQDKLVEKKGPNLPGFTKKEQNFFSKIMISYAGNYKIAADFTHAGAVHAAGRLVSALEQANDRLLDIEQNPSKYQRSSMGMHGESVTKTPAEFWNDTMNLIVKISDALRKMNQSILQSNELRLKIEKLRQSSVGEPKKAEPGWESPKA